MVPINKTVSFSEIENLKLALKAEANNPHQNILSLTFVDTKKEPDKTFSLVFQFEMSSKLVNRWYCQEKYGKKPAHKTLLNKKVNPVSLDTLYENIIEDIEQTYKHWLDKAE